MDVIENAKVKSPTKRFLLREKKTPAAFTLTGAAPLLLLHCLRSVYVRAQIHTCERHCERRSWRRQWQQYCKWTLLETVTLTEPQTFPTIQRLIAAIIWKIVAAATSSSTIAGQQYVIDCVQFSKQYLKVVHGHWESTLGRFRPWFY